jgi:hypothetical protein
MGKAAEFKAGCPFCGYLQPREQMQSAPVASDPGRRSFLSARSSRIAIIALLVALAALVALLLLKG